MRSEAIPIWQAVLHHMPTRDEGDNGMSLGIRTGEITAVLLVDGWHDVLDGTFGIDTYEYVDGDYIVHSGREPGFGFVATGDEIVYGPLTAILAVSTKQAKEQTQ